MTKSKEKLLEELDETIDRSNASFQLTAESSLPLSLQPFTNQYPPELNDKPNMKVMQATSSKTSDFSDYSLEASESRTPSQRRESKHSTPSRRVESFRSNQLRGKHMIISKRINEKEKRIRQL